MTSNGLGADVPGPRLGRATSRNVQSQSQMFESVSPANRHKSAWFEDARNSSRRPFKAVERVQIPLGPPRESPSHRAFRPPNPICVADSWAACRECEDQTACVRLRFMVDTGAPVAGRHFSDAAPVPGRPRCRGGSRLRSPQNDLTIGAMGVGIISSSLRPAVACSDRNRRVGPAGGVTRRFRCRA